MQVKAFSFGTGDRKSIELPLRRTLVRLVTLCSILSNRRDAENTVKLCETLCVLIFSAVQTPITNI